MEIRIFFSKNYKKGVKPNGTFYLKKGGGQEPTSEASWAWGSTAREYAKGSAFVS